MTPEEKIEHTARQIAAIECGHLNYITCPYCEATVPEGHTFCCDLLRLACCAVIERQQVERIGNGIIN